MSIMISGTPIALVCLVRGSEVPFKVTFGRNNDVFDFKKIIKNEIPNTLANLDINEIQLWKLNEPISVSSENIEKLQKISLQDNENITLLIEGKDIVYYWAEGQILLKTYIHVIVDES
ncbi:crinkler family protein [Gigaspora margarita]|uniref:Crinkler family protein n=1 Tax=Gigaspora margarita TaxID=4874 RepID=A0A8H4AUX8_GIGMA|nr:crinkler family protein [Gigaspora margarita]